MHHKDITLVRVKICGFDELCREVVSTVLPPGQPEEKRGKAKESGGRVIAFAVSADVDLKSFWREISSHERERDLKSQARGRKICFALRVERHGLS